VSSSEVSPSLDWLIDPVPKEIFFNQYWETQPLVVRRNKKQYFGSLFSLDEADRAITTLNLTYPNITLKNANREVKAGDYTAGNGTLDVASVYQLFNEGSTIVLAFLDTVIPTLTSLCRSLERELNFPLQMNAYLTPPRAQGARHHYDTHDVFVLQIVGSKRWTMYGTPVELPLSGQDFDSKIHQQGPPTMEFELKPGDLAYIPRGVVHDARSSEDLSLHITLGILCYRWADLLLELVADASVKDPAFRKALPPGFAREGFDARYANETLQNLLQRLATRSDSDSILSRFSDQWISACPPVLRGQMDQIALIDQVKIDSLVGARPSVVSCIRTECSSASIYAFGRKISFPAHAAEAVRFALSQSRFSVRDLPGNLDDNGKLVLVERLIREGLMLVLAI
jgi:ribosomal protein L16 Arg81 hydroxylase